MNRTIALVSEQMEAQEDLRAQMDRLEQYVCELLLENQTLRMALLAAQTNDQSDGHSHDLSELFPIG